MANRGRNLYIFEPCSDTSTLHLSAGLRLAKTLPETGMKGQVWTISGPPTGGLDATADYVNHTVSISPSPANLVVRVGDGIDVEPIPTGLRFSVGIGYNVIPVCNPNTGELGYFKAEVPPKPGKAKSRKPSKRPRAK